MVTLTTPDEIEAAIHKQSDALVELINFYLLKDKSKLKFRRTFWNKRLIIYFDLEFSDKFTETSPCEPTNYSDMRTLEGILENTDIGYVKKVFLSKGWKLSFHRLLLGESPNFTYQRIKLTQITKPLESFPQFESTNPYR